MKAEESVPAVRYLWVDQNLDLSRKLDMVRVRRSEYTLLDIKVSGLQFDIREIRDKLKIA